MKDWSLPKHKKVTRKWGHLVLWGQWIVSYFCTFIAVIVSVFQRVGEDNEQDLSLELTSGKECRSQIARTVRAPGGGWNAAPHERRQRRSACYETAGGTCYRSGGISVRPVCCVSQRIGLTYFAQLLWEAYSQQTVVLNRCKQAELLIEWLRWKSLEAVKATGRDAESEGWK